METIGLFSGVLLFSALCLLPEVRAEKTPIPFCEPLDKVLRKKTSFSFVRSDFFRVFPTTFLASENFEVLLIENRI